MPAPPRIVEPFAVSGLRNAIPVSPGGPANAASFDTGFPAVTMQPEISGGLPPLGQDVNGILYMLSSHTLYVESGMPYPFDATLAAAIGGYAVGTILGAADGASTWLNTTPANSSNPDTGGAGWVPLAAYGQTGVIVTGGTTTLSALQYRNYQIKVTGVLVANATLVLPTIFGNWLILNETTGAFNLTVKTAAGAGIVIPQTGAAAPTGIFCDGVDIQTTSISTAGLAPIANPHLTGVPTAPTAAGGTNTTQIATTAFVEGEIAPLASLAALAAAVAPLAPLANPHLTGVPTAPTNGTATDASPQIATDAFVQAAIAAAAATSVGGKGYFKVGTLIVQWGLLPAQSDSNYHPWTFAGGGGIAFPTACFGMVMGVHQITANAAITGAGTSVHAYTALTAAGFNYIMSSNWNIGGGVEPQLFYIAVGN